MKAELEYVKAGDQKRIARFILSMGEYDSWDALTQATFDVDATTFEADWNQYLAEEYPELTDE